MPPKRTPRSKSVQSETKNTQATPSNKRTHSPPDNDSDSVNSKKKKSAKMSTNEVAEITKLISQSQKSIENKIHESQTSLETKFDDFSAKINVDVTAMRTAIDDFKTEITSEMNTVKEQVFSHTQRLDDTEDDIQRLKRSQDLRLTGFPVKDNENLVEIFTSIAKEIGYDTNTQLTVPSLERIPFKNRTTGEMFQSPIIMMHFMSTKHKQSFYSYYLNKMPLKPAKFGLPETNRIVIGENLTKKNIELFKQAQTMKKKQ